jgi:hypothetical protein
VRWVALWLLLTAPAYAILGGGVGGGGTAGSAPLTAISINEVVTVATPLPVIQRSATANQAAVSFSGTYTGGSPASVFIQIVDFTTHATVVQSYQNCSTSFVASAGLWSCKLVVPTYSNWVAAIAGANSSSPSIVSSYTGTQWGVGSIIVMAGDSLAGFYPTKRVSNSSPSLKAVQWCTNPATIGTGANACQPLGVAGWGTINVVNIGYGYLSLIGTIQPAFNWPVAVFNSAQNSTWLVTGAGGTSSVTWTNTSCGGGATAGPWCNLTANLALAGITDFESVIWYQGGQDSRAGSPPSSASVVSALQALYLQFLGQTSRTKAQLPMFVDQLGPEQSTTGHDTGFNNVRAGIQTASASNGSTYNIVFSSSCIDCVTDTDQIHPNPASYSHTGYRDGQTMLNYYSLSGGTYPGSGPSVASCTRATTNLTQVLTANGAASLVNSSGSSTLGALTGWGVTDSGGATVSSFAGSGTSVVITMNQNAAAGDGVTYLQGENPTITNLVYSNVLPGADTLGMPLLPTVGSVTCP